MARDRSGGCDTGMPVYKTKAAAEKARPGEPAKRCARCRQWHSEADRKARGRRG
jgi:hypothetical protein